MCEEKLDGESAKLQGILHCCHSKIEPLSAKVVGDVWPEGLSAAALVFSAPIHTKKNL